MTRRRFLHAAFLASAAAPARVAVPIHRITDAKAQFPPGALDGFWHSIWPQAARDFASGGIDLQTTDGLGSIGHTAADRPFFTGLVRGALNLIVTDRLPLYWDDARALSGVTTFDRGYCMSLIALRYAHGNRAPLLSTNTCTHEILHALLLDVFVTRPSNYQSVEREYRVDWYATRLWLFGDGAAVRESARKFVAKISS